MCYYDFIMKTKKIKQIDLIGSVRKPLPPPSRPFKDKKRKQSDKRDLRKELSSWE